MSSPVSHLATALWGTGMPGGFEIVIVLAIVLIIFGPKRLPALSRAIGKSITDFKRGLNDVKQDIEDAGDDLERKVNASETGADDEKDGTKPDST